MSNRPSSSWNRMLQTLIAVRAKAAPSRGQLAQIEQRLDLLQREMRLVLGQATLPPTTAWRNIAPHPEPAPGPLVFAHSTVCRQESFHEPYFAYWTSELHEVLRYHRKLWEFVFICQALHERGLLTAGKRGLGFGVGGERLSAYFAGRGCQIVGTDLAAESAVATGWIETAQHASGKEQLRYSQICPDELFDANVEFRPCDMNLVDNDLTGFNFCWSACALEHLGTIDHGLRFIERSIECLRPGGVAVHTTELNIGPGDETLERGPTVLFRRRDMEALAARLTAQGHSVAPFDFAPGGGQVDRYIDLPPYLSEPHLTMALGGFPTTSVGLIIQRAP